MGIFEKVFKKQRDTATDGYFEMLNGYSPAFSNAPESLYEMDITRAAIHSYATFCSKLKPEIEGSALRRLEKVLQFKPNPFMDTTKFLYRLATILAVHNTAFIVPIEGEDGAVEGLYPVLPINCEVIEHAGIPYIRYTFGNGKRAAIELEKVGILTQHQYADDLFGSDNKALYPTMQLITTQNQGIINGVKNSAYIRFIGKVGNVLKDEDVEKFRKTFADENLSSKNNSGLIVHDKRLDDLKQVYSKPFTVDGAQMERINDNVFRYFGTNDKILKNSYSEDEWGAYYEGKIEPFAIQLSLVLTNILLTQRQIAVGNNLIFTANRLQYASNKSKLEISTQLFDRGILSTNKVMDIWNMAHVPDGDKRWIRKEYAEVGKQEAITKETGAEDNADTSAGAGVQEPINNAEPDTSGHETD